jgi:hypothetical protein
VQTSPVDHVVRLRRHRGQVVLAAVAMVVALLGASALVLLSYSLGRVAAGAAADSLSVDTLTVFDADPALPATQVSTATVINNGTTDVQIDHIDFTLAPIGEAVVGNDDPSSPPPPTVPLVVFPGENCTGATVPPNGYCAVSVRYTNPGQRFDGFLVVTAHDGSTTSGTTGTLGEGHLDSILADPYVVDFGSRPVGTTSPAHTVTIGAAPSGNGYQVVGVSVVDTVPTPGDKADYRIATDGCTGADLRPPPSDGGLFLAEVPVLDCAITVTDTPGAAGDRPAFLSVAYCSDNSDTGIGFASEVQAAASAPSSSSEPPSSSTQPPLDNNVFCPTGNHIPAFHQLVSLTGNGQAATTTTPPPTTTTTTAPPTTTTTPAPPPTFTPKVTAIPPLAPAGRTTGVSGTGFPPNTLVTFALVPPNTDPGINLGTVPGFATATTDGSGNFTDKIMVIMPHTPAGQYEILATALFGRTPVSASVGFLVAPGSEQPPKFVDRH